MSWFSWKSGDTTEELPNIFPIAIKEQVFTSVHTETLFSKILIDTAERIKGLSDDQQALLSDNFLQGNSSYGVVTWLAWAMTNKAEIYLIYDVALQVIREATSEEKAKIKADYTQQAESSLGIYVSFKEFELSDMVQFYAGLEFSTVAGLSKTMELSKAIQFKMSGMRSGVSLASFDDAKAQGVAVAKSLGAGKDVLIDKEDIIETAKPDLASVQASIDFIANKLSFYLGLPASWITGEQTTGMGTTGENDTKAIERGLKRYYTAILKPVLEALFKTTVTYKSQDFRQITTALEAMKTFELTSEELLNHDNKKRIIEGLLDIDEEDNVTVIEPTPAPQKLIPAGPVPPGGNA